MTLTLPTPKLRLRRRPDPDAPARTTVPAPGGQELAPGPPGGATAWVNLQHFRRDAPTYFLQLRREYGDTVRLPLGFFTVHLPFAPADVSHVLQAGNANFVRGKGYDFFRLFMGTGLLTLDGPGWKERRRIVNPLFHRRCIEGMVDAMASATSRVLDRWATTTAGQRGPVLLDVVPESMHITLDALGSAMFDSDLEPEHGRIGPAMDLAIRAMLFRGEPQQLLPPWTPVGHQRQIRAHRAALHGIVHDIVRAHRDSTHRDRADLVSLLLQAQDEPGSALSDDDIRDELMTIFMAGHETSGTGVAWALTEVARHPEVQARLQDEVDTVLGGREPALADLPRLTYVRQVVDETLRLHPPIWVFPRGAVEDDTVGGYRVPAGESVFLCPYVTHRHPELWSAPGVFDPDRFGPGSAQAALPRFAYFPFGGGQRKCIGAEMALQQTILAVAMVAQRFTLAPGPGLRTDLGTLVSLRPLAGLQLQVSAR